MYCASLVNLLAIHLLWNLIVVYCHIKFSEFLIWVSLLCLMPGVKPCDPNAVLPHTSHSHFRTPWLLTFYCSADGVIGRPSVRWIVGVFRGEAFNVTEVSYKYLSLIFPFLCDFKLNLSFFSDISLPVAQAIEHGANNTKVMVSISRSSKNWSYVYLEFIISCFGW